jgi:ADP-ribose pyrophosphatase
VVPVTSDGDVVLIHQYRHGAGEITLETPGGLVDPGETPEQAAVRELREETGYRPARVTPLGSVNPNPALFRNRMHAFVAWDVEKMEEVERTDTEETVVELVSRERVFELVEQGVIDHALVVAVLFLFERLTSRAVDGGRD